MPNPLRYILWLLPLVAGAAILMPRPTAAQ
jgi:hypothetical protein